MPVEPSDHINYLEQQDEYEPSEDIPEYRENVGAGFGVAVLSLVGAAYLALRRDDDGARTESSDYEDVDIEEELEGNR